MLCQAFMGKVATQAKQRQKQINILITKASLSYTDAVVPTTAPKIPSTSMPTPCI
jgi:hypothetical protein